MPNFSHLHVHTQFSLLDGAAPIASLMQKAKADNMRAVAMTDHGNMFGAFQFVAEAAKVGVTPIVGCEFYLVEDRFKKEFKGGEFEFYPGSTDKDFKPFVKRGHGIFFASFIIHRVKPVTKGKRQSFTMWFGGPPLK